jgi:hypothetical protein
LFPSHDLQNILIGQADGLYGYYTNDTFMTQFEGIQVAASNNDVSGSVGIWFDDQATGSSGTSCTFTRCWVRDGIETSYKFHGLTYSVLNGCGTDRFVSRALDIELSDITLNGFGFEDRQTPGNSPLYLRYSRTIINSTVGFSVNIADGQYVVDHQGGVTVVNGLRHTTTAAGSGLGRAWRVADNGVLEISAASPSSSLADTTPFLDGTSSFIDRTNGIRQGLNNYEAWNSRYDVTDSSGNLLAQFGPLFTTNGLLLTQGSLYFGTGGEITLFHDTSQFRPYNTDGTINLGSLSNRWNTVYAATGTINTSDRDKKDNIGAIPEAVLDAWGKIEYCQFKFKDAIESKGSEARLHIGVIAQEIYDAFASTPGAPDPFDYGILCYEEWDEVLEEVDEEGNILVPAAPAGKAWAVRPDECLYLESAYMRRELKRLKES